MRLVLILLLLGSLAANIALGSFVLVGIVTRSTFTDMMRKGAKYLQLPPVGRWQPNKDYQAERDCDLSAGPVILVIGQSNAANAAYTYTRAKDEGARAYQDGKCYTLYDPVIGGDGTRGSQWPLFADLYRQHFGRSVTVISASWGGSTIANWSDNGYDRFALAQVKSIRDRGARIAAVFWQQGESDPRIDPAVYKAKFGVVMDRLRQAGVDAPIFVAQATLADGVNETLRAAQRELAQQPGYASGPDGDTVTDRFDNYHLGAEGVRQMAQLWLDAVIACNCVQKD